MRRDASREALIDALAAAVGEEAYSNWFRPLTRVEVERDGDAATITVSVATPYLLTFLRKSFGRKLADAAAKVFGDSTTDWAIDETLAVDSPDRGDLLPGDAIDGGADSRRPTSEKVFKPRGGRFETFAVSESNRTAWSIARGFATQPQRQDSIVYLYGPTGCGKTHLAEAVQNAIRQAHPRLRTLSMSAWDFGNDLGDAIQNRTTPSFRARFRGLDVLILDNVCFFDGARKESFQEGLLQTIAKLQSDGKSILLTGSVHPRMLTRTSSDLVGRYLAGHVGRVGEPDRELRREVVRRHAESIGLTLTPDAADYVATKFRRTIREVHGALNTLCNEIRAEEDLQRLQKQERPGELFDVVQRPTRKVGVTLARKLLGALERDTAVVVRLPDIDRKVCEFFSVDRTALHGPGRSRTLSRPRMVAMYLARRLTPAAYKEIGEHFGGRNHSTVMSAEKTVRKLVAAGDTITVGATDWDVSELLSELERRLSA